MKLNTTVFGTKVTIAISGETGIVTGFSQHMRMKQKQFFVEYQNALGVATDGWFTEDQLVAEDA